MLLSQVLWIRCAPQLHLPPTSVPLDTDPLAISQPESTPMHPPCFPLGVDEGDEAGSDSDGSEDETHPKPAMTERSGITSATGVLLD